MHDDATRRRNLSRLFCVVIALLVIIGDQITKAMVARSMPEGKLVPVVPGFFNLTHTTNTGVAVGMFSGSPAPWKTALLVAVSAALIVVVVYLIWRSRHAQWGTAMGFGLVLGGAISNNLMDRVRTGQVVDFLDFYWRGYHWPAFNMADSAIVVGAGFLAIQIILAE
jgi:signal peptidase II